jgi:hypothetical protein
MGKASPAIVAFNAGELSPQMEGRVDVDQKYPLGCHIQQNFIPLKQGPAIFRPGSAYVATSKTQSAPVQLVRFEFSQTQAFVLEFGDRYVRFYTNHGPLLITGVGAYNGATAYVLGNTVLSGGIIYYCIAPTTGNAPPNATYWYPMVPYQGSPTTAIYEIPSPYAVADLEDALGQSTLLFEQSGDVLYLAGGNAGAGYAPRTLTRYANAPPNWQFAAYAPTDGPFADALPLTAGSEIALSVSAVQGVGITISAWGGSVFAATDVGRLVRLASQTFNVTPWSTGVAFAANATCTFNGNNYLTTAGGTSGGSPPVHTQGSALDGTNGVRWLYTDSGYGVAQITAYVSATQVTATVLTRFPANVVGASATITAITQANPCVVTAAQAFAVGDPVFLTGIAGMTQLNQVAGYTSQTLSATTVTLAGVDSTSFGAYTSGGTIIKNASVEWQLGAWSASTEWPRALAFYKDRLFWGGKLNVWGSVPGLYSSHTPDFFGVQTTDSAMNELLSGLDASPITWMSSAILLLIGTQGGEYGLDSANFSTSPLGPANVEILKQSQWRSRPIRPEVLGTTVIYVQRGGRKVFAMDYTLWLNRYDSTDQSKYAYHITIGGIVHVALQREPWSLLWAVRADGTLLSYTFNREDNVTAWARHNLGGNAFVDSVAVIPSPDGTRDELWLAVRRVVNGAVVRTIEYLAKPFEGPQAGQPGDAQSSAWYVDCGVQYQAPGATTITGVTSVSTFNPTLGDTGQWTTTITYQAVNTFAAGAIAAIAGVTGTGTLQPNGVYAVATASPTQFTVVLPGQFSFLYTAGGTCSVNSPTTGTTTITGIPAVLQNQLVSILADGGKQPQQTVSGTGTLTLPGTFNTVTLGFPYQGNLVPMRFEGGADVGTAQGKVKQGANLVLRLVDSMGGLVAQLSNIDAVSNVYADPLGLQWLSPPLVESIRYNDPATGLDIPPPIQSGDYPIMPFPHRANSDQDARDFYVLVQQGDPFPMTVVGLFPNYTVSEPA